MNLDTMEMGEQELKQLKIELEGYLDSNPSTDEIQFTKNYNNDEQVAGFYCGFKAALYTMQKYPELLKEKKDEAQE